MGKERNLFVWANPSAGPPMLARVELVVARGGWVTAGGGRHWACSRSGALPQPLGQQGVQPIPVVSA